MHLFDVARQRLYTQHIAGEKFNKPSDVVRWFGAVQAQDYLGSLWAIGLRTENATEKAVEQAIAERTIIRTWPMRGTLHFVAAADIRWMLELLTPRAIAKSKSRLKQLELDNTVFIRCRKLFVKALRGGKKLQRNAIYKMLETDGIVTTNNRGLHILGQLSQEGLICFAAREGKQPTFALLEEWVPAMKKKQRDEALAELAWRYFVSHGPATLQDFVWWSGLTMADAKSGLEMVKSQLEHEATDGRMYWFSPSRRNIKSRETSAYLLPAYDEYTVAYKDRSAVLHRPYTKPPNSESAILGPTIVIDGQVVGIWKRTFEKRSVVIKPKLFASLKKTEKLALTKAARRYGEFLGLPATIA
jgi:hypothetical protein